MTYVKFYLSQVTRNETLYCSLHLFLVGIYFSLAILRKYAVNVWYLCGTLKFIPFKDQRYLDVSV